MKIGTRGSKLALEQANRVKEKLSDIGVESSHKVIETAGDRFKGSIQDTGKKGVFVREIDKAVLNGDVDLAVHSMKDMPSQLHSNLEISSVPERVSPYDVLVTESKKNIHDMDEESIIGTSSARRKAQILKQEENIKVGNIRGNIDTRIEKLKNSQYDGLVLAKAGLERLSIDINYTILPCPPFVPSPNQGAIAVIAKKGTKASDTLEKIDSKTARLETSIERKILEKIGGGCSSPLGIYAQYRNKTKDIELVVQALSLDRDKELRIQKTIKNEKEAEKIADKLIKDGVRELI